MEWNDQMMDDALRASASSPDNPANLPSSSEIWEAIHTKRKRRQTVRIQKRWAVAATVLLLITAVPFWFVLKKDHTRPVVQQKHSPERMPAEEKEAVEYINRQCMGNNIACFTPVFKELQAELDSSSAALATINQQIKLFGNDEQLLRAKTRIENHQAQIVKAMVQIL